MKNIKFLTMLAIAIAYILAIGNVDAAPYQELEPRKGYIPVYIRYGDTPLSDIHPKLAEAFNDDGSNHKDKIESADLKKMKETSVKTQTETGDTSILENSDPSNGIASDIASFDVIKGEDDIHQN